MHAIRCHSGSTRAPRVATGWSALLLVTVLSHGVCRAQDISHCGRSTVEDAWGPKVASQVQSFLTRLQAIVRANEKVQFASLVHYPVRVLDGNRRIEISSRSALVQKYSSVVTPDVRRAILTQSAACLFANGQGVMIGRGQVWFQQDPSGEMRIITINLTAPSP